MNILENELVKKYFGCDALEIKCPNGNEYLEHMALRVLAAMQEPIKNGERYLHLSSDGEVIERVNEYDDVDPVLHVSSLRLPSKFQPKRECEKKEAYLNCRCEHCQNHAKPQPEARKCIGTHGVGCSCMQNAIAPTNAVSDKVEEQIKFLANKWALYSPYGKPGELALIEDLKKLVALAREK